MENNYLDEIPEYQEFMFMLTSRFDDYVVHMIETPATASAMRFLNSLGFAATAGDNPDHICSYWTSPLSDGTVVALVGGQLSRAENLRVRRCAESNGLKCMSFCTAEDGSATQTEFLAAGASMQQGEQVAPNRPWWRFG